MAVSTDVITIDETEMQDEQVLVASEMVLGNGKSEIIKDIIYVKRESFDVLKTHQVCTELERINKALLDQKRHYLLIGFGRWGTSDPTCGIPVNWGQISGAKAVVEASLAHVNFEQSQGSHFFHNVTGFGVHYFSVPFEKTDTIGWEWLDSLPAQNETEMVRHVQLSEPLKVMVDGRVGHGVILKSG
jgi:hypothetical protein